MDYKQAVDTVTGWEAGLWEGGEKNLLIDPSALVNKVTCSYCEVGLVQPYIQCCECTEDPTITLCLHCFTKGIEFDSHRNNHSYIIVQQNFSLLDPKWLAKEESLLLTCILECGFGNWVDISRRVGKSANECKNHYMKCYLEQPCEELFVPMNSTNKPNVDNQRITYYGGVEEPPRPLPGTVGWRELAGYNAARADFNVEFDNNAEDEIKEIDLALFCKDPDPLGRELEIALLDSYRRKLGERYKLKRLIRDHGLINLSKAYVTLNNYKLADPNLVDFIPKMYQLLNSEDLNVLMIGIRREVELKNQVMLLKEYRIHGLKRQFHVANYETFKKKREFNLKEKHNFVLSKEEERVKCKSLKRSALTNNVVPTSLRRLSLPLDITNKPGYDSLNEEEKFLSSELRFLPRNFFKFKRILIDECMKHNGLKLAHARTLIKVDVNKIRKLYDYLMSENLIFCANEV